MQMIRLMEVFDYPEIDQVLQDRYRPRVWDSLGLLA